MAIRKYAQNIIVRVNKVHHLQVGGKLEKIAAHINKEATKGNFTLISNKQVTADGNKH